MMLLRERHVKRRDLRSLIAPRKAIIVLSISRGSWLSGDVSMVLRKDGMWELGTGKDAREGNVQEHKGE